MNLFHTGFIFTTAVAFQLTGIVSAQVAGSDAPVAAVKKDSNDAVYLGIGVAKPSSHIYAQLPSLPKGCGFILSSVIADGPAAKAGLKPMDIIWKLNGQMLINESQMLVLLSHHKVGDVIKVAYFRAGQQHEAEIKLQTRGSLPPHPGELAITPPLPGGPAMPMRVVSYEDRSASISDKTGVATLTYREGKPWLQVENIRGEETYNGFVEGKENLAQIPVAWRSRLPILLRSLEESARLRKLPRVRRVPTPRQRVASDNP